MQTALQVIQFPQCLLRSILLGYELSLAMMTLCRVTFRASEARMCWILSSSARMSLVLALPAGLSKTPSNCSNDRCRGRAVDGTRLYRRPPRNNFAGLFPNMDWRKGRELYTQLRQSGRDASMPHLFGTRVGSSLPTCRSAFKVLSKR